MIGVIRNMVGYRQKIINELMLSMELIIIVFYHKK
jgi:hypothetical protein